MIKEITKSAKINSLDVASGILDKISDTIVKEASNYIVEHYKILNEEDIDTILDDDEWWSSLLENLIDNM
jgi:hypothetical protein